MLERPDHYGSVDEETIDQMRAAVEDPEAVLRIYRAVPPEHQEINAGDWISLSRAYAHDHGYVDDGPDWPVVCADVPADRVWTDGNDPSEYGYAGPDLTALAPYAEGETMPPHPLDTPPTAAPDQAPVVVDEEVEFTPSAGARTERRIPPTTTPSGPAHGTGPVGYKG